MNQERRRLIVWTTIAGVLFMTVAVHDLYFLNSIDKSKFLIILETVAGICFLLNAGLQWKKQR